jgi:diguanylate cyclase (GGDEF)-like protein
VDAYAGDGAEVGFRLGTFRAGIGPSFLATVYGVAYALWTWDHPHRTAMLVLFALVTVAAIIVLLLPLETVVRSRWREPFFLSWSAGVISLGMAVSAIDGGASSPLAVLLFLPLVFAALSYPLGSMLAVSVATIGAYVAMALIGGHIAASHAFVFACALLSAAWICTWQSMNHSAVRRDLARVSRTDALTGVLNRRGFEERFDRALETARRTGERIALVLVDLDAFKAVNDEGGHAAGDELLRWVAGRLRATVRGGDDVGRLGGDEFAVLLSTGADDAEVARARIAGALAERAPASVGAAIFPGDGEGAEALHRVADTALYARKRERRSPAALRRAA